jgi:hypothetical protein
MPSRSRSRDGSGARANSDCLHCSFEKRQRRERMQSQRMRAHEHFVSQKLTDCSSPKEESLPIQNRNRAARAHETLASWNQNGESQWDIDGECPDSTFLATFAVRDFLSDGGEA